MAKPELQLAPQSEWLHRGHGAWFIRHTKLRNNPLDNLSQDMHSYEDGRIGIYTHGGVVEFATLDVLSLLEATGELEAYLKDMARRNRRKRKVERAALKQHDEEKS